MGKSQKMTERQFAQFLEQIVDGCDYEDIGASPLHIRGSLKSEGYLTDDVGLVIDTEEGQRFLITIQEDQRR